MSADPAAPARLGGKASPRVVLPITSRGIEVTDRLCWAALGVAMAAAAALILHLNRGTTFYLDELLFLTFSGGSLKPSVILEPHNGHLIATTRLVYKATVEAVGADYVAFRVLGVGTVLLCAGLFYALVKRWLGALPALAPALVLLFFGSAWQHVVIPIGFTAMLSIAFGLGALLALERRDRRGDIAASVLLVLSLATYTTGLPFVVGGAVSVLLRPDRWRRAWVFALPLALYAVWWAWSLSSPSSAESETKAANFLLIPSYVADSLAAVAGAITGLNYDFTRSDPSEVEVAWGRLVAALAVVGLVLRVLRRNVPAMVWVALAIVLTYWSLTALADSPARSPSASRYMFLGATGVLLAASAAVAGIRFSKLGLAALFAAAAVSVATNAFMLRDGAGFFRNSYSALVRAQYAMVELAREHVDPGFDPSSAVPGGTPVDMRAGVHLTLVDQFGSHAYTPAELERQPEAVRELADRVLVAALGLELTSEKRSRPSNPAPCRTYRSGADEGQPIGFAVPAGGARLRARAEGAATVSLRRFASLSAVEIGALPANRVVALRIPADASPLPWHAAVAGATSIRVCPLSR